MFAYYLSLQFIIDCSDMHTWCSAGHGQMRDMGFLRRGAEVDGFDVFGNITSRFANIFVVIRYSKNNLA
jgi:hypothetical protein